MTRRIQFRKGLFRGMLSEIARERGITRQAVYQAVKRQRPWIMPDVHRKVEERQEAIRRFRRAPQG